jgi:hypothetical protein
MEEAKDTEVHGGEKKEGAWDEGPTGVFKTRL